MSNVTFDKTLKQIVLSSFSSESTSKSLFGVLNKANLLKNRYILLQSLESSISYAVQLTN